MPNIFDVERLDDVRFQAITPDGWSGWIYGGQLVAQAMRAAYQTVDEKRVCHALHCNFFRMGDPAVPLIFEVDALHDGRSLSTRRVTVVQHGRPIMHMVCSFATDADGLKHQIEVPPHLHWSEMLEESYSIDAARASGRGWQTTAFHRPIQLRTVEGVLVTDGQQPPHNQLWFKSAANLTTPIMHQAVLAYASDTGLINTALRPHPVNRRTRGVQAVSLDHSIWFHGSFDFNQWHLYVQDSPISGNGRVFAKGAVYSEAGVLIASTSQEGLVRFAGKGEDASVAS
jgi:acyl-CoA thioesterase-2